MKKLLENDFPAHYSVGRRRIAKEVITNTSSFDLIDTRDGFVVPSRAGSVSFRNPGLDVSVIAYEDYLNQFDGTKMADGRKRCDFILTDQGSTDLALCCELTSRLSDTDNLSAPITKEDKDGVKLVLFAGGKYEKAEMQLFDTLDNIMNVPSINRYISSKCRRVCLMAYTINPKADETATARNAFNRSRMTEASVAGENGAQISSPAIESFGFQYYRISHNYVFDL